MEGRAEGKAEGRQETQKSFLRLIQAMSQNGDSEKIPLLAEDPVLLKEMCKTYHIDLSF